MRALLDTSVLIDELVPAGVEAAISVVSITELHVGALVVADPEERARPDPEPVRFPARRRSRRRQEPVTLRRRW